MWYTSGLATIDDVTRMTQEGNRPAAVCFFFPLGRSNRADGVDRYRRDSNRLQKPDRRFYNVLGAVETLVSVLPLLPIAARNTVILLMVHRMLGEGGCPAATARSHSSGRPVRHLQLAADGHLRPRWMPGHAFRTPGYSGHLTKETS